MGGVKLSRWQRSLGGTGIKSTGLRTAEVSASTGPNVVIPAEISVPLGLGRITSILPMINPPHPPPSFTHTNKSPARGGACFTENRLLTTGSQFQFTVILTFLEGMPLATTSSELAPVSIPAGTSKLVETVVLRVATPMVLWSCVFA